MTTNRLSSRISKITLQLILILLAAGLVLSACQQAIVAPSQLTPTGQAQPSSAAGAKPTPARSVTPAPTIHPTLPASLQVDPQKLRGLEVRFWHPWSGSTARQVVGLVEEFNRENVWGIQVTVTAPGGDTVLFQNVSEAIKGSQPPAVVAAPIDQLLYWRMNTSAMLDLNEYLNSAEWGLSDKESQDFFPVFWQQDVVDGQRLGLPAERTTRLIIYNQTWAKELGFTNPPTTPLEFRKQICAGLDANVKDDAKANDGTGGWIVDRNNLTLMSWIAAYSKPDAAQSKDFRFNTPEAEKALTFLRQLFDQGCAWNSRLPQPYEYFANRQALLYTGSLADFDLQEHTSARLNSKDQWNAIAFVNNQGDPFLLASGPSYGILKSEPETQLAAWLFIRWMILTRNQVRLVEAGGTLPLSASAQEGLKSYASSHSYWAEITKNMKAFRPMPLVANWWLARNILEDAGWQLIQPTPQPIPSILKQLDDTIPEILQHQP